MKLTLSSLADVVVGELRRDPARSSMEDLINEAGEAWANAASWVYLRDRAQDVEAIAGVDAYKLGLGVRNVTSIDRPTNTYGAATLVDFDAFERFRNQWNAETIAQQRLVATIQYSQREDDDRPRLYLLLFPAKITERLRIIYEAGWLPLNAATDVADVPGALAPHFRDWLRAYANHREKPEEYPMGFLDQFKRSQTFMAARKVDGKLHRGVIPRLTGAGLRYERKRQRGNGPFYTASDYLLPGEAEPFS